MDHYPFTTFIELFCSLNPVQMKEASASPERRREFEERFCRRLKELKLQVIALHHDADSDELSRRYFNDYLCNLCQYMELLTGQLGPDGAGEYFKKKHRSDYTSFIASLLTCVNRDIRNLAEFFGKYFDYDAPAPALTGLEFYLNQKDHLARLIRKMKKRVDDAELVQVIENFIHSFAVKNNHSSRPFSDCRCLHRLGIVMQQILQRKSGKDTGDNLSLALMTRGFNDPAFVMHCLGWLNKKLPAESGRENVLLKLHELGPLFVSLKGDQLQLPALQSLCAACTGWRDDTRAFWLSEEQFEARVQERLLHRLDQMRFSTSLSARALAMFARCLYETKVITNKDLEKLLEIWRLMFITVRNHNKETAEGSFKKAFYGTDKKVAATLKGVFDTGLEWLNRKTKLNERDY